MLDEALVALNGRIFLLVADIRLNEQVPSLNPLGVVAHDALPTHVVHLINYGLLVRTKRKRRALGIEADVGRVAPVVDKLADGGDRGDLKASARPASTGLLGVVAQADTRVPGRVDAVA